MKTTLNKTLLVSNIALILGTTNADAALFNDVFGDYDWSTSSGNMTILYEDGGVFGGANDVSIVWDGNAYSASSDYAGPGGVSNVTVSSTMPFLGNVWTMHEVQMFLPGTYSFDVSQGGGNLETGTMTVTVGGGQLGMHMLWDWNGNINVDMFMVFALGSTFGSGLLYGTELNCATYRTNLVLNCLYDGPDFGSPSAPVKDQVWMLASVDGNGDGIMGLPMMSGGPLGNGAAYFNFNANLMPTPDPVPIPAAAWLLGSGLLGLAGAARGRTKNPSA